MITIKRNLNTVVAEFKPLTSSTLVKAVMGDEQITLAWEQAQYTELHIGDYIEYEGAQWTLNSLPTVKKNSSRSFRYDAIFQSTKYDLAKAMFLLFDNTSTPPPPGEVGQNRVIPPKGEFSMTGNAQMFMELLVANLNRVAGSSLWSLGQVIEDTDYITLTFSNEDCLSVLSRLADEFDTEYHISNRIIHLKRISTNRELTLEYRSTLYDVERLSTDDSGLVTRLYPYGSTRNLPGNYRGGNMPLCIPEDMGQYIESENALLYGIAERSMTFGEVYPRLSSGDAGVVTSMGVIVESETFIFTDAALDFDVNDHLLDGTKAKVHFNTGQCAGYEFEIHRYSHSTKTFTLIPNNQENDFVLPTEHIRPQVGDKYVLLDIAMPESYRVNAEQELAGKAAEWLGQNDTPKVTYKATFSAIYARQNLQNVECGDTVQIVDSDLGIDEEIRIVKLTKGIADYWTVQFDLSDTVTKTTLQHITDGIATVQNDIVTSNVRINENTRRNYLNTKELREMIFDGEGYFDPENIKPLSIETSMLTVGARPQSFQLSMLLQPNYAGNAQVLQWGAGVLAHFTIDDDEVVEWVIPQGSITISGSNQTKGLYIYARCSRTTSSGTLYLDSAQYAFDHDPNYWYFLVGVLHSPVDGVRGISLTYGQTTINGRFLNTGRVQSANGKTFFDLDTGVIQGNIRFKSGQSAEDYIDGEIDNIDVGGENLLTHNPENWELGSFNSTTGAKTSSSTSIRTKNAITLTANADHIISRFGSGSLYIYEYSNAAATAFVKMTTITAFPHPIPKQTAARYYKFRIATSNLNLLGSTYKFKVEKGNKPTDWSIPTIDLSNEIKDVRTIAGDAQSDAQDALAAAGSAQTQAQALGYLSQAFQNDTAIEGGIISSTLVRLGVGSDNKGWVESAGIFGGHTTYGAGGTPGIYLGGTLEDAIARVNQNDWENGAKFVVTHGGKVYAIDAQLMGSLATSHSGRRIVLNQDDNAIQLIDDNDVIKALISSESIPSPDNILSATTVQESSALSVSATVGNAQSGTNTNSARGGEIDLPAGKTYRVTTPRIKIAKNIESFLMGGQRIYARASVLLIRTGQWGVGGKPMSNNYAPIHNETYEIIGAGTDTADVNIPEKVFNNVPFGKYNIYVEVEAMSVVNTSSTITVSITSPYHMLIATSPIDVGQIYSNGLFFIKDGFNYMVLNPADMVIKSQKAPDIPGVLLVGEVNAFGGGGKFWGAKKPSGILSKRDSAGVYTVNHDVGHKEYIVQALSKIPGRSVVVSDKEPTSFKVSIFSGTTNTNTAFEFAVFGNN